MPPLEPQYGPGTATTGSGAEDENGQTKGAAPTSVAAPLNLGFIAMGRAASLMELSTHNDQIVNRARQHLRHAFELSQTEIPCLRTP